MPERSRSHEQETESNRAFERALPSRWVDRRLVPDYGLDYTVEIIDENRQTTPFSFHAQLKATDEPDVDKALASIRFDREWAEHYWSLPIPVLIVRYHAPSARLFARWFHAYNASVALRRDTEPPTKTIGFRFTPSDEWTQDTPGKLEAAVHAFMRFRSPELDLPLRFAVFSDELDVLPTLFALRAHLAPVADLAAVESAAASADRPHIRIGAYSSTVALADVASVTLDYPTTGHRDRRTDAADLATAMAIALTRVGQPNLAAQVAAATASTSHAILDYDVAFSLAQAFYRARRVVDGLRLADALAAREEPDARIAALLLQTASFARGTHGTEEEADAATEVCRRRLTRSEEAGDNVSAAADAYNLGQALARKRSRRAAIDAYRRAVSLDPRYGERGYFNSELAGLLFEDGQFEEAASLYRLALPVAEDPMVEALMADALLWSGRYGEADEALDRYLAHTDEARDAEWRLKQRALGVIREIGGDQQQRNAELARALIAPFDFAGDRDFNSDDALKTYRAALKADACSGEAWFRLAFLVLVISDGQDTARSFELGLCSAVLHRASPGAWNNTIRMLRESKMPVAVARDCLRMAYRFCGSGIADTLLEREAESEVERDDRLLTLLDEVMREVDDANRPTTFTMRVPDDQGVLCEFSFVTEIPPDTTSDAHAALPVPPTGTRRTVGLTGGVSPEVIGDLQSYERRELESFAAALEERRPGFAADTRLVIAELDPRGLRATVSRELAKWMPAEDYEEWRKQQRGRTVATAGKTFVAKDGRVTAVVCPVPSMSAEFLAIASRQLIEIASRAEQERHRWRTPDTVSELHGLVLFEDYSAERLRQEIGSELGWRENRLDAEPGLVAQTDDLARALDTMPVQGPPPHEFWVHWVNISRVWAMVAGRRAGGSRSAARELALWARHDLIIDDGWSPVDRELSTLHADEVLTRDELICEAARRIWEPIEVYGADAWAAS